MTQAVVSAPLTIAREAARRLTIQEKAQLLGELAQEIVRATPDAAAPDAGLARFTAFAAEFRATYPHADVSRQLDDDRHAHDLALRGETPDVHA